MKEATPEEIKKVQEQLAQTPNDPNMAILECHCFSIDGSYNCEECPAYLDFAKRHPNHLKKHNISKE